MKRIPTHDNIVAFPKHLKGKAPKDCMCPYCEVVLESGVEYELYLGYDDEVVPYLLQVFIESGEKIGIPAFKEAIQSLNREGALDEGEEPLRAARAAARSAVSINNNCNSTTGSVRTSSQQSEEIAKILFPATKTLVDKRDADMSDTLKRIVNVLYREARVEET